MDFTGILIGLCAFLIIGFLHPIVVKTEYHFGKKCWPVYAIAGLLCCVASTVIAHTVASVLLGILAFSLFWSIHELFEQEERVRKGWYPSNPARNGYKNDEPEERDR